MNDGQALGHQPLETLVMRHSVRPGHESGYRQLAEALCRSASASNGCIDSQIDGDSTAPGLWRLSFTFVSAAHARQWQQGRDCQQLLAAVAPLIDGSEGPSGNGSGYQQAHGRAWHAQPFAFLRWPPQTMPLWQRLLLAALLLLLFIALLPLMLIGLTVLMVATLILRKRISSVMRRPFR
ncbi:MAG: hypothetical protein II007_11920 [Gammaproteobacteria bacterium]|nr:hypothetical protein [Gammaproteobacteria bacterium]